MSTTNPIESNLQALLSRIGNEGSQDRTTVGHHNDAAGPALVEQILAATSELERQITSGALDAGTALGLLADHTLVLTEASGVAVGLVEGAEVVCRAAAGVAPDVGARAGLEEGLAGECIRRGSIVRWDDTAEDVHVDAAACQTLNLRSAMVVPIYFAGSVVGVLEVFSAKPNAFDELAALAMGHLAQFIGGVMIVTPAPTEAVSAATPPPVPSVAASRRDVRIISLSFDHLRPHVRQLWQAASRHSRFALLLAAVVVTASAAWYSVREMIRSTRPPHSQAEANLPAEPSVGASEAPPSPSLVPTDPAIAREEGPLPAAAPSALGHAQPRRGGPHLRAFAPAPLPTPEAPPLPPRPQTSEQASGPPRKPEVAPEPPALAAVQPATQRDTVIAPLVRVPEVDPTLAAPHVAPPEAGTTRHGFVSRVISKPKKLKGLVRKDQKKTGDKPGLQNPGPQPQAPLPEN